MNINVRRLYLIIIAAIMVMIITPASANAVSETGRTSDEELASGVWESTVYVTESNGRNIRAHIIRINNGANASIKVSTPNYYTEGSTKDSRTKLANEWNSSNWGYITVDKLALDYESSDDSTGTVVAGLNGDFYDKSKNGETLGKLIVEGNVINPSSSEPFFAVLKDGTFEIRSAGSTTSDVVEAVSGPYWLLQNSQVIGGSESYPNTISSIGVTSDNDVVLAVVDGREPTSEGTCGYDVGTLMQQQGCTDAIMLDCGGSTSFLTRRDGDSSLVFRNTPNDGVPRGVSSALLIVQNEGDTIDDTENRAALSMVNKSTHLDTDSETARYYIEGTAQTGLYRVNDKLYLFDNDGNGVTKDITIGLTKYSFVNGLLESCDDAEAGAIAIGYCGADEKGEDLLYAYHYGDKKLNIGLNPMVDSSGRMEDWGNIIDVPWQTEKHDVKRVVIGEGVKNIGDNFLRFPKDPFNDALKKVTPALTLVSMPSSLTRIGKNAFQNQTSLKTVVIPENVDEIRGGAFEYDPDTSFVFKGTTHPTFGKKAFKTDDKSNSWFIVPNTADWKSFAEDSSKMKKSGFSGQIKIAD